MGSGSPGHESRRHPAADHPAVARVRRRPQRRHPAERRAGVRDRVAVDPVAATAAEFTDGRQGTRGQEKKRTRDLFFTELLSSLSLYLLSVGSLYFLFACPAAVAAISCRGFRAAADANPDAEV